jgi:hypothetical protein
MSSRAVIKLAPAQGHAIKEVGNVKHQTFKRKRSPVARDRKEKEKEKEKRTHKSAASGRGRVRDDGIKGGPGSKKQHADSGKRSKKERDSKVRGSLVDVII